MGADMGVRFDGTINLGNVISALTFLGFAIVVWRDLSWRLKNLENWRVEHTFDSKARDTLIRKLDMAIERLDILIESRTVGGRRSTDLPPNFSER